MWLLRARSSAARRSPLKNENRTESCPRDPFGVSIRQEFFPANVRCCQSASPSFASFQIYTFFHDNLKNQNLKIGLSCALGTY